MHLRTRTILCVFIMLLCFSNPGFSSDPAVGKISAAEELARTNPVFAANLYQQLRTTAGNLFFSPYSIRTSLAMAYAGARGRTAEQMQSALSLTLDDAELHKAFAASIKKLNTGGGDDYEMNVANSLWRDTTCVLIRPYRDAIENFYTGGLKKIDFKNAAETARIKINAWVEDQTHEKIRDLIPPGGVTGNTRLALVNAVYFKGTWNRQFDKKLTRDEPFFHADGTSTPIPLMSLPKAVNLPFYAGDGIKIVELAYSGDDISMLIILPDTPDGLQAVEENLNQFQLNRWLEGLQKQMVKVLLPRFSMHWGAKNLVPALRQLGMRDAFVAKVANFSGIDGTRELLINSVFHKTFIEVNEEGTEAAAATGTMLGVTSMPPPPEIFRADRPFIFLIREKHTKNILFMGRLSEPDKK